MAVEFALVSPLLIYITLCMVNFALLVLDQIKLSNAVSAGATWAITDYAQNFRTYNQNSTWSTFTGHITLVASNASGLSPSPSVTPVYNNNNTINSKCYCVTGTMPNVVFNDATCNTSCSGFSASLTNVFAGKFVQITATYNYTPIIPNPLVGAQTLSEYAIIRLQ